MLTVSSDSHETLGILLSIINIDTYIDITLQYLNRFE